MWQRLGACSPGSFWHHSSVRESRTQRYKSNKRIEILASGQCNKWLQPKKTRNRFEEEEEEEADNVRRRDFSPAKCSLPLLL